MSFGLEVIRANGEYGFRSNSSNLLREVNPVSKRVTSTFREYLHTYTFTSKTPVTWGIRVPTSGTTPVIALQSSSWLDGGSTTLVLQSSSNNIDSHVLFLSFDGYDYYSNAGFGINVWSAEGRLMMDSSARHLKMISTSALSHDGSGKFSGAKVITVNHAPIMHALRHDFDSAIWIAAPKVTSSGQVIMDSLHGIPKKSGWDYEVYSPPSIQVTAYKFV